MTTAQTIILLIEVGVLAGASLVRLVILRR